MPQPVFCDGPLDLPPHSHANHARRQLGHQLGLARPFHFSGRSESPHMRRQAVALLLSAFVAGACAISPLTPRLSAQTHARLLAGLAQSELPEVGHNSVVIAITEALGFEAASRPVQHATDHAHLPRVRGRVTRVSERCARVEVRALLPNEPASQSVEVEGTYCLVGPAVWDSARQAVRRSNL
jgi:hypothetical protein